MVMPQGENLDVDGFCTKHRFDGEFQAIPQSGQGRHDFAMSLLKAIGSVMHITRKNVTRFVC
jgi:hypothetical protein